VGKRQQPAGNQSMAQRCNYAFHGAWRVVTMNTFHSTFFKMVF